MRQTEPPQSLHVGNEFCESLDAVLGGGNVDTSCGAVLGGGAGAENRHRLPTGAGMSAGMKMVLPGGAGMQDSRHENFCFRAGAGVHGISYHAGPGAKCG